MGQSKIVSLDRFVEKSLYDKKFGYYSTRNPFGVSGDFITSPLVSILFGEMIAIWTVAFWESQQKPKNFNFIELGPGDGSLCKTLLNTFKKFPEFYNSLNVYLYEKSEHLIKIQKKEIKNDKVLWIRKMDKIKNGTSLFFGNEFFDAIPIKQFEKKNKTFYEKFIRYKKKDHLEFFLKKASKNDLKELKKFNLLKKGGVIEYPKMGIAELNKIISVIKRYQGGILLIDYGYKKSQKISTIQSIKAHKKNSLFKNIGNSDITSLVNFSLLKNLFIKNKLKINKIVSQSFFLQKIGILKRASILASKMTFREKSNLYFRIQRLLSNKQMGALFKVAFAYKGKKKFTLGFEK